MTKNYGFLGLSLVVAFFGARTASAQSGKLTVTAAITFGNTLTTDSSSNPGAVLQWAGTAPLPLDSAIAFPITGTGASLTGRLSGMPFRVTNLPSQLVPNIAAGPGIRFKPNHNILNNSEVVICSGTLPGCIAVDVRGQGKYAGTYYNATENLSEQALRSSLKTIISTGYTQLGYDRARDRMFMDIDNKKVNGEGAAVNTLECVYTGRLTTGFASRQAAQGDNFNTEHTMPQSTFGEDEPMKSDLHHLFPTDNSANSTRGNHPFDTVGRPTTNLPGGSKYGQNQFEPRDVHKGKAARALMYYATRYQDEGTYITNQEAILREWHRTYPPTQQEVKRNDLVQPFQRNRNPYSDHPELLERITKIGVATAAPEVNTFRYFPAAAQNLTVTVGDTLRIYATIVNTGNQELTLTNPTFPSTNWAIEGVPPVPALTVAPGEALNARLRFVPATAGREAGNFGLVTLQGSAPGSLIQMPVSIDVLTAIAGSFTGNVRVWPGVFSSQIRFSAAQPSTVVLLDLQGRPLWSTISSSTEGIINTEHLSPGSYFVRVAGPQGVRTFTVVK